MNMITPLNPVMNNPFEGTFDGTPLDFCVKTDDLYTNASVHKSTEKKAVIKLDHEGSAEDWWVVGKDYPIKTHRKYYDAIEREIIDNMDPNHLQGVTVQTKSARNGRWGLRDYLFPNVQVPIKTREGHETTVSLRIVAWSGLDGYTANNYMLGAIDNFCTNGMVFTQAADKDSAYVKVYKRNTKNFNLSAFAVHLRESVELFYEQAEQYRKMALVPLQQLHGQNFIDALSMSESKRQGIKALYNNEIVDRGSNVFALHSALTNYSSHQNTNVFRTRTTKNDVIAETMFKREEEVAKILTSKAWHDLMADSQPRYATMQL
jgi:hypothetical protein